MVVLTRVVITHSSQIHQTRKVTVNPCQSSIFQIPPGCFDPFVFKFASHSPLSHRTPVTGTRAKFKKFC